MEPIKVEGEARRQLLALLPLAREILEEDVPVERLAETLILFAVHRTLELICGGEGGVAIDVLRLLADRDPERVWPLVAELHHLGNQTVGDAFLGMGFHVVRESRQDEAPKSI